MTLTFVLLGVLFNLIMLLVIMKIFANISNTSIKREIKDLADTLETRIILIFALVAPYLLGIATIFTLIYMQMFPERFK